MNDLANVTEPLAEYLAQAALAVAATECEVRGKRCPLPDGVALLSNELQAMQRREQTCWLFGNGGSGTIADHIACDMVLKGWRAHALTNPALTTTMANDFDFAHGFGAQLQALSRRGDVLIGMSCSGESANVRYAMDDARMFRVAMTGFRAVNSIRKDFCHDVSFWVPSMSYGAVQIAHLTLLHAALDLAGRWRVEPNH